MAPWSPPRQAGPSGFADASGRPRRGPNGGRGHRPAADPDRVKAQIEEVIGIDASDAVPISAKTGMGVPDVLEALVKRLPPPQGEIDAPLKAMLIDLVRQQQYF